jgi:hypothetical protein
MRAWSLIERETAAASTLGWMAGIVWGEVKDDAGMDICGMVRHRGLGNIVGASTSEPTGDTTTNRHLEGPM